MNILILAGGFGTRMYPLTKDVPKALLKIKGRPMMDYVMEKIIEIKGVENIYILSNNKFYIQFLEWCHNSEYKDKIKVINNGVDEEYQKKGAIGDIKYVLDMIPNNDFLVIASDNLFTFDLKEIADFSALKDSSTIIVRRVNDIELIKKYSCVLINEENKVIDFEEKPKNPKGNMAAIACYFITKLDAEKIKAHNFEKTDNMGYLMEFLHKVTSVYAFEPKGEWMDIGSAQGLEQAQKLF